MDDVESRKREIQLELARNEHEYRLEEQRLRHEHDLELEEARRKTALMVEEQRNKTAIQAESCKGKWALGAGLLGVAAGALVAVLANAKSISQRDMNQSVNNKRLLK